MTGFRWTDATGAEVELDGPSAMQAEVTELDTTIDRLFREVSMLTGDGEERKRRELRSALIRHNQLKMDIDRWNEHVEQGAHERARALANEIRTATDDAKFLRLIVSLHDEFELVSANNPARLQGEPSHTQQRAAELAKEEARNLGSNFRTAFERLQLDSKFYRPESDEGGWFEWRDGQGVICRLASPLAIEREIDEVIAKLYGMVPKLEATLSHLETVEILTLANDLGARLTILRANLKTFENESARREDEEWERAMKEWQARNR